ncbi:MAG: metallopeptidase TldD-related protein [Bryobacteraceae bacterium]|nr:metallopeptidase TldD-related protein [Bryobacteraceae bacterium]
MSKVTLVAGLLATAACFGQPAPLLDTLKAELERNMGVLKEKADPQPYFLQYGVIEQQSQSWTGTFGALQNEGKSHTRILDVNMRVGNRKLDNYHSSGRGERLQFSSPMLLPLEDSAVDEIRRRAWLETDRTYRRAAQRLINLKTSTQVRVAAEDDSDDFSTESPSAQVLPLPKLDPGKIDWAGRVRTWSGLFSKYPSVLGSAVSVRMATENRYLVNSEGTRVQHGRGFARITMMAQGKADDGMDLFTTESFEAENVKDLPDEKAVETAAGRVAQELTNLLKAPVVDPFVGPAILSGRAAAVFFHEIFGHRIEGHRQKDESEGQTFTKMVNGKVLPDFLSITFDPTQKKSGNVDLNGTYAYDDEGVKARPVKVVENGTLKTFLMSRSPIRNFPNSNGHGRKQAGLDVVSRQSNLIVESSKKVSEEKLRDMLIEEIRRQNKPYGFRFDQVTGGFTTTSRASLQAYTVIPLIVYRVYPDGRPDELVRGVDIVGTPLASFQRIIATGDRLDVFNGYCGAESGSVPVAAVSPALLVSEIEIQKKDKGRDRPPLLPAPPANPGGAL